MKITTADIGLAIYGEITDEIVRGNESLLEAKIATGLGEVYSYLHRYDTDTMFGDEWQNPFLKSICVNVIAWHLITLCAPNISMEVIRQNYEDAVSFLKNVQKGAVRPEWPLRPNNPDTPIDEAGNVAFISNQKRNNHY